MLISSVLSAAEYSEKSIKSELPHVEKESQLDVMSHLIGGKWWMDTNNYQEFEWGLGHTQIKMKKVIVENDVHRIITEGFFYYSPDSFSIKGISTSQQLNKEPLLMEYFGNIQEDKLEFIYKAITPDGNMNIYTESWTLINDNQYNWQLISLEDDSVVTAGQYNRKYN